MKQKRFLLYILIVGLLILATLTVYVYQEYLGEDTNLTPENGRNPIISQPVNGIVTSTSVNTIGNQQKLAVTYTNIGSIGSTEEAHFTVNAEYEQRIHLGDTVMKDKWEKMLLIHPKDGNITIVPID